MKQPTYATLRGLLGKEAKDPTVAEALQQAGKLTIDSDFIVAKESGFDFGLDLPVGKRKAKKVLATLFLFAEGKDKHRGFTGLPKPFAFGSRDKLVAKLPAPISTQTRDAGDARSDSWMIDGLHFTANYRDGVVEYLTIALPHDALGGRELSTHPLHFETKPADAPADADLVGMALLVAWAIDRHGLPPKHAAGDLGKQLAKRAITPRAFLVGACDGTLTTQDVDASLGDFLWGYTNRMFLSDDDGARAADDKVIKKLLHLGRDDERAYTDDFLGTFKTAVKNPFHVPDSWEAVDRIAPVLDARWADYQATKFAKPAKLALYERAAKLREARAITATRANLAKPTADDDLANELVALIDRPLADPHVKAVITRAGMPVGKRIDEQANPALGVSYMGAKFTIAGKHQLGVDDVAFYATGQTSYIRGLGAEVEFVGYPAALPHGLVLGESRASVVKKLGTPKSTGDDYAHWELAKNRITACQYAKGKLVKVRFGRPADY